MGLFDLFKKPTPEAQAAEQESLRRQADILMSLRGNRVPTGAMQRLQEARLRHQTLDGDADAGRAADRPLARAEPIAAVSATCWLHYGWSWTEGHAQGWETALRG
jgi:hypothetical protein